MSNAKISLAKIIFSYIPITLVKAALVGILMVLLSTLMLHATINFYDGSSFDLTDPTAFNPPDEYGNCSFRMIPEAVTFQIPPIYPIIISITSLPNDDAIFVLTRDNGLFRQIPTDSKWHQMTTGLPSSFGGLHLTVSSYPNSRLYLATDKGAFQSSDGGVTWSHMEIAQDAVQGITIDSGMTEHLYAWTKTTLLQSFDAGQSWDLAVEHEWEDINLVVIDPDRTHILYLADKVQGLHRSTDAGKSWQQVLSGNLANLAVHDIVTDDASPGRVWVTLWQTGIIFSEDYGLSWKRIPLPPNTTGGFSALTVWHQEDMQLMLVGPSNRWIWLATDTDMNWQCNSRYPGIEWSASVSAIHIAQRGVKRPRIYVGMDDGKGILSSQDGGASWQTEILEPLILNEAILHALNNEPVIALEDRLASIENPSVPLRLPTDSAITSINSYNSDVAFRPERLLIGTSRGSVLWQDEMVDNVLRPGFGTAILDLWVKPNTPKHVVARTANGLWFSEDQGGSWQYHSIPTSQNIIAAFVRFDLVGSAVCLLDSSGMSWLYQPEEATWTNLNVFHADPVHKLVYAQTSQGDAYFILGGAIYKSTSFCKLWTHALMKQNENGEDIIEEDIRSMAVHPLVSSVVYLGTTSGVLRSLDSGTSWELLDFPIQAVLSLVVTTNSNVIFLNDSGMLISKRDADVLRPDAVQKLSQRRRHPLFSGLIHWQPSELPISNVSTVQIDSRWPDWHFLGTEDGSVYSGPLDAPLESYRVWEPEMSGRASVRTIEALSKDKLIVLRLNGQVDILQVDMASGNSVVNKLMDGIIGGTRIVEVDVIMGDDEITQNGVELLALTTTDLWYVRSNRTPVRISPPTHQLWTPLNDLFVEPTKFGRIYLVSDDTLWYSTDTGISWRELASFSADRDPSFRLNSVVVSNTGFIFLSSSRGILRTINGDWNWLDLGEIPRKTPLDIKLQLASGEDRAIYALVYGQDSITRNWQFDGLFKSMNSGEYWFDVTPVRPWVGKPVVSITNAQGYFLLPGSDLWSGNIEPIPFLPFLPILCIVLLVVLALAFVFSSKVRAFLMSGYHLWLLLVQPLEIKEYLPKHLNLMRVTNGVVHLLLAGSLLEFLPESLLVHFWMLDTPGNWNYSAYSVGPFFLGNELWLKATGWGLAILLFCIGIGIAWRLVASKLVGIRNQKFMVELPVWDQVSMGIDLLGYYTLIWSIAVILFVIPVPIQYFNSAWNLLLIISLTLSWNWAARLDWSSNAKMLLLTTGFWVGYWYGTNSDLFPSILLIPTIILICGLVIPPLLKDAIIRTYSPLAGNSLYSLTFPVSSKDLGRALITAIRDRIGHLRLGSPRTSQPRLHLQLADVEGWRYRWYALDAMVVTQTQTPSLNIFAPFAIWFKVDEQLTERGVKHYGQLLVNKSLRLGIVLVGDTPEQGAYKEMVRFSEQGQRMILSDSKALIHELDRYTNTEQFDVRLADIIQRQMAPSRDIFNPGIPIQYAQDFYGSTRKELLTRTVQRVQVGQHILIFGLRKTGKTSTLNFLDRDLGGGRLIAKVDLQEIGSDALDILRRASVSWRNMLESRMPGISGTIPPLNTSDIDPDGLIQAFSQEVDILLNALPGGNAPRLVLILDEIERLDGFRNAVQVLAVLRGTAQRTQSLVIVAAGINNLLNQRNLFQDKKNPVYAMFQEEPLRHFSREDTQNMIASLARQMQMSFTTSALDQIFWLSGGQPFIAQRLLQILITEETDNITVDKVHMNLAAQRYLSHQDNYVDAQYVEYFDSIAVQVLESLCYNEPVSESYAFQDALERLRDLQIVDRIDGRWTLRVGLIQLWIERNSNVRNSISE